MKNLLVLTHSRIAARAIPWLYESSTRQHSDLLVTNCVLNPIAVPGRVAAWPLIENPQKVRNVIKRSVENISQENITIVDQIAGQMPWQELEEVVRKHEIDNVYFPIDGNSNIGSPDVQFAKRILQNLSCSVIILDLGKSKRAEIDRIIVPMDLTASGHAMRRMMEIGHTFKEVVPLHVSSDFGGDAYNIAQREIELQLKEAGLKEIPDWVTPKAVMADGFHHGIMQTVEARDAIIISGTSVKLLLDLRNQLRVIRPQIASQIPIGIYRPATYAAKTVFGRFVRKVKAVMPELTLADRISLFDRIQGGARLSTDYIAMICLSVLMASFGLIADNTSVVIGAMLVAPFMTPLIGFGLAIAQGNLVLMKRSAIATSVGLLAGLVISYTLGSIVPLDELPLEVLARGDPNLVDLAIAFVSGMAAAYAISRESVAEAIVGVAIAAALVPPLACIGIMLATESLLESEGAIVLLVTNLAAIALGAAFVFRRLGVPGTRTGNKAYVKIRWISASLVVLVLMLAIPLSFKLANRLTVGQIRPMSFRVSTKVSRTVYERVDQVDGVNVMFMGRSGSGRSRLIRILIMAEKPIPADLLENLITDVKKILGEETPVMIGVFRNWIRGEFEQTEAEEDVESRIEEEE